jgi:hypothetical protein
MASCDRLKAGETADAIRKHLHDMLLDSELSQRCGTRNPSPFRRNCAGPKLLLLFDPAPSAFDDGGQ